MIVKSGTPFGFDYTAYDGNNSLFVAGNVYDISSGTPVFLSQIPMVVSLFGTYVGIYTGVAGVLYLIETAVYTDGTYVTRDTSRSPGSDTYQCIDLTGAVPPTPTQIATQVWNTLLSGFPVVGTAGKKLNDLDTSNGKASELLGFISASEIGGTIEELNTISGTITEEGEIT